MRTDYNCIGAYLDVEGFIVFRFVLIDGVYKVYESDSYDLMPDYLSVLEKLEKLASKADYTISPTIDVYCNFPDILKTYLLNNWSHTYNEKPTLCIRTTDAITDIESSLFSLFSVLNNGRLSFAPNEFMVSAGVAQINKINRQKLKAVFEGSESLALSVYGLLHSVAWLESQRVRYGLV
jgi:hypothetical protein